ncbi:hypothetical protein X755_05315 [Mesorhizobium sp. LNJC405B00]|nr:hypothetical protein X755_05315 [Mesorhizobium sp. LNJC405B00]
MRRRVARLVESGADPERILAVTFTRIAAEDVRRELNKLDVEGADEIQARTLHSFAMRILRKQWVINLLGRVTRPLLNFEIEPLLYDLGDNRFGIRVHARSGLRHMKLPSLVLKTMIL